LATPTFTASGIVLPRGGCRNSTRTGELLVLCHGPTPWTGELMYLPRQMRRGAASAASSHPGERRVERLPTTARRATSGTAMIMHCRRI
jgi:hypothetical protein